jgi:hypothetical protein
VGRLRYSAVLEPLTEEERNKCRSYNYTIIIRTPTDVMNPSALDDTVTCISTPGRVSQSRLTGAID